MNTIRKIYLVLAASLAVPVCVSAQQCMTLCDGTVRTEEVCLKKGNGTLTVSMGLNLDSLKLAGNSYLRLTPVLSGGAHTKTLEPILVVRRRQEIMYYRVREKEYCKAGEHPILVRHRNRKPQRAAYRDTAAWESWMNTASLDLREELCACRGIAVAEAQRPLAVCDFEIPVYEVRPAMAYVTPAAEAVKHRAASGSAYLDFPVNKTSIDPDYRGNAGELAKIRATVEQVRNDRNTHITHISIHGYASPEGPYAANARLAQGRAEALKEYVRLLYGFDEALFEVQSTPEDWAGLRRFVDTWNSPSRKALLEVIDSNAEPDAKNWKLQGVDGKRPYDYLLKNVYPTLRHSDYTVEYTVRRFDVEEAKEILKTRPQLLSLNEMFLIAQTYEPGSREFDEVFDVAVRMFPDDPTANLNAATAAISEGAWKRAEGYLAKAGDTPEAIHARGVCALMQGRYNEAETLLREAGQLGVPQAAANLEQLRLKRENLRRIEENGDSK